MATLCRLNLSSGENLAGWADSVTFPSGLDFYFCCICSIAFHWRCVRRIPPMVSHTIEYNGRKIPHIIHRKREQCENGKSNNGMKYPPPYQTLTSRYLTKGPWRVRQQTSQIKLQEQHITGTSTVLMHQMKRTFSVYTRLPFWSK